MIRTFRAALLILPHLLASVVPPAVQAIEAHDSAISWRTQSDDFADRGFSSGSGLFYAGPEWFLNALSNPRARNPFVKSYLDDSSGDRLGVENGYVGTLRDVFDVGLFSNIATFGGASGSKTSTPIPLDGGAGVLPAGTPYLWQNINASWNVVGNWTPTTDWPNAQGDTASNIQTTSTSVNQNTPGGVTVGAIGHDAVNVNTSWTITATTSITMNNGGTISLIRNTDTNTGTSNFLSIGGSGGLVLSGAAGTLRFTNSGGSTASSGSIQLNTPISGTGPVTGAGAVFFNNASNNTSAGQIAINAASTFTGNSTIEKGAVTFNNNTPFGQASNQVALGLFATLDSVSLVASAPVSAMANTIVVTQTGDARIAPRTETLGGITAGQVNYTGNIILNTAAGNNVTLTSASTVSGGAAQTVAFTNVIQGTGGVTVTGTSASVGFTEFTGSNTYQSGTLVNSGTLLVNNTTGSGTGVGLVSVNNSGTLGGTGFIVTNIADVTINGGGNITGGTNGAVAATGAVGALTLTAVSVDFTGTSGNLASYIVDLTSLTSDKLVIHGNLDLSTTFDQLIFQGVTGAPKYVLVTYTGTRTGTFDVVTPPTGYVVSYAIPNEIDLVMTEVPEPSTWISGALALIAIGFTQPRKRSRTGRRRLRGLLTRCAS
jgi:hypothetical protein